MFKPRTLILVISIGVVVLAVVAWAAPRTNAQGNAVTLQMMFQQLNNRLQNETNFAFSIQVNVPVKAESLLVVGTMPDAPSRTIHEIGSDYVCLREPAGLAESIWCLPFSNIASITWINAQQ